MTHINATGIKGFLLWLKANQPGIYAKAAPQIAHLAPRAFSDFNYQAGLGALAADLQPIDLSAASDTTSIPTVDVASAANAGASDSSITSVIGDIVNGISSLYLTKQQADAQSALLQTQLARAQAGLPPLPVSTAASGIPTIAAPSPTLSGALPVVAIVGGLLVLLLMSSKRRG